MMGGWKCWREGRESYRRSGETSLYTETALSQGVTRACAIQRMEGM